MPGVVISRTDDGYYEIGTAAGKIDRLYHAGQFLLSLSFFLSQEDAPNKYVTLENPSTFLL